MAENQQQTGNSKTYYKIIDGDIRRKAKPDDNVGFVTKRTLKTGEEVDEYKIGSLSGLIKSMAIETKEFGGKKISSLEVLLSDVGENYLLQIPVESKYFASFIEKLPNVDYSQYVTVSVYDFIPSDSKKKKTGVTIKQAGNKVTSAFSKENPLPGVGDFPIDGDEEEVKLWGIQRTKALKKLLTEEVARLNTPAEVTASQEETGDLPF